MITTQTGPIDEEIEGTLIRRVSKLTDPSLDIVLLDGIRLCQESFILAVEVPLNLSNSSVMRMVEAPLAGAPFDLNSSSIVKRLKKAKGLPVQLLASVTMKDNQDYNKKYQEFIGIYNANIEPRYRDESEILREAISKSKNKLVELDRKNRKGDLRYDYVLVSSWVLKYKSGTFGSWFKPYFAVITVAHGKPAEHSNIINLESSFFYNSGTRNMMLNSAKEDLLNFSTSAPVPVPVPALTTVPALTPAPVSAPVPAPAPVTILEPVTEPPLDEELKVSCDKTKPIWG